jgi:hypothetical protein
MATGNAEILAEIKDMRKEFDARLRAVENNTALTHQTVSGLCGDVDKLNAVVISGNGSPPLKQTVKELVDDVNDLKSAKKETRSFWRDFGSKVLQTGVGAAIGMFMAKMGWN